MRLLAIGRTATSDDLLEWSHDGQRRVVHRPGKHGWHYAHVWSIRRSARKVDRGYWCDLCKIGIIFDEPA